MKKMNTMMLINNMIVNLCDYKASIKSAETYEDAKRIGSRMVGYLDGAYTVLNTLICEENNDLTAELDEVLTGWEAEIFGTLADKAVETDQDRELILELLKRRDACLEANK